MKACNEDEAFFKEWNKRAFVECVCEGERNICIFLLRQPALQHN